MTTRTRALLCSIAATATACTLSACQPASSADGTHADARPPSLASTPATDSSTAGDCLLDPRRPVAFVGSGRANQPLPRLTQSERTLVGALVDTGALVSVVSVSATPTVAGAGSLAPTAKNQTAIDQQRQQAPGNLETALSLVPPVGEADVLGAIDAAARWLSGVGGGTLVLKDSGIATSGALNHTQPGMLTAQPTDVTDYLATIDAIPDLAGITVLLSGIGEVAAPQERVTPSVRHSLTDQYRAIARAGHADCVAVDAAPSTSTDATDAPPVTPVAMPAVKAFTAQTVDVALPDSVVGFVPGKAALRDRDAAVAVLSAIAPQLDARPGRITVTGTTASWGSTAYRKQLSTARASVIRDVLVDDLGIDAARIRVVGAGSQNPWHVDDLDPAGRLLPGPAEQNRSVHISFEPRQ